MTTKPTRCVWALGTSPAPGAIAVIHLRGDLDPVLAALGVEPVRVGAVALRTIPGIDDAVIARPGPDAAVMTPHGGPAVIEQLGAALTRHGAAPAPTDAAAIYPEAAGEIEALTLHALSRAASPRAAALLLDQPRRWRTWTGSPGLGALLGTARALGRLITPPVVAAAGGANLGKSTLANALAGRRVALTADEPGVTRDHVGVSLVLDGLAVRWVDTPGLRAPGGDAEAQAIALARGVIARADLVVLCADASCPFPDPAPLGLTDPQRLLRAGLRADLGPVAGAEIEVSALRGEGLADLAAAVRARLVPDTALDDPAPWVFDEGVRHWAQRR